MTRTLLWGAEDYSIEAYYEEPIPSHNLNDNLSNYDMICIVVSSSIDIQSNIVNNIWFDTGICFDTNKKVDFWIYLQRYMHIAFSNNAFEITGAGRGWENPGYIPIIYKIYGYKW